METGRVDRERRQRLFELMQAVIRTGGTSDADTDVGHASSPAPSVKDSDLKMQCLGLVILEHLSVTAPESKMRSKRPDVVGAGEMVTAVVKVRGNFPKSVTLLAANMR